MVAQVAFQSESPDEPAGVVLPAKAVHQENGNSFVYINQSGVARKVQVNVSDRQGKKARVTTGLTSGQRVIIDAPEGLVDGVKVDEP